MPKFLEISRQYEPFNTWWLYLWTMLATAVAIYFTIANLFYGYSYDMASQLAIAFLAWMYLSEYARRHDEKFKADLHRRSLHYMDEWDRVVQARLGDKEYAELLEQWLESKDFGSK